jgi:hypothetical protein
VQKILQNKTRLVVFPVFLRHNFFFKSKKTEKKILSSFEAILPHPLQSVTWLKKKVKNEIYLEDKNVNRQIVLLLVKIII